MRLITEKILEHILFRKIYDFYSQFEIARKTFAADLTVQNMEIQFDISHVESYRQSLCQTADSILRDEIPTQLRKIEDILQGQKLKSK